MRFQRLPFPEGSFLGAMRQWLSLLAGWLLILGWLWRDSLRPGWLAFCNDAPYGLMAAFAGDRWDHLWQGSWSPLVWLGGPALPLQLSVTHGLYLLGGPVAFGKFAAPLSLLMLATAGFVFGRALAFPRWVSFLMSLALGLNTNLLSHAAWGLGSRPLAVAATLMALAALVPSSRGRSWLRTLWAGGLTGLAVVEGADVGALLSLVVAAFCLMRGLLDCQRPLHRRALRAVIRLAAVAGAAALVASHALVALVGTQVRGVAVLSETPDAQAARWTHATAWSFPKLEVLRFVVPGLMGYRPDTPDGGAYWGCVGWDGTPATRSNGGGEGMGILVLLLAGWAVLRAAVPGTKPVCSVEERVWVSFWAGLTMVALLLAFGRFAPFYQWFYALPGADTMRMPMKFLHLVHLGMAILAGYGLTGMARACSGTPRGGWRTGRGRAGNRPLSDAVRSGLPWVMAGSLVLLVVAGLLAQAVLHPFVAGHLLNTGVTLAEAGAAADFSIREVRWSAGLACLSVVALGVWRRSGGFPAVSRSIPWVLGGLLVLDLGRSASWFIVHYDAARRYQGNDVLRELAAAPWTGRVTARWFPDGRETLVPSGDRGWHSLQNQWMEEQFPFLGIQTLDIWQMPRMPALDAQFLDAFRPKTVGDLWRLGRLWQLTNVRKVLAPAGAVDELNRSLDPANRGFRELLSFAVVPRDPERGVVRHPDDLTVATTPGGPLAVYSLESSLPRVGWFSCWEVPGDEARMLARLRDPAWDASRCVLLSTDPGRLPPSAGSIGDAATRTATTEILEWTPRRIRVRTDASSPGILLLNERWDPVWQVHVDASPEVLLRANHLMRAVQVPAGRHEVVFAYRPRMYPLAISGATWIVLLGLIVIRIRPVASAWRVWAVGDRSASRPAPAARSVPARSGGLPVQGLCSRKNRSGWSAGVMKMLPSGAGSTGFQSGAVPRVVANCN
ncbi:MAG: hypothetical protein J0L84_02480 [Verrucomicrobia bacterium]|nr:hypothetical protein [Verrucomicrobiota bacterium]